MTPIRSRKRFARRAALLAALGGTAVLISSAAALPGSNFEIETNANLVVNGASPSIDWLTGGSGTPLRSDAVVKNDDPSGSTDDSFGNGTKEDTAVPSVVDGGIPPNKSDLKHFGVHIERTASGKFLNLFWTRVQDPSGTTNMDFEFNQSRTISANGETPVRTSGDLLITYDLSNGGTVATIAYRTWNGSVWGAAQPLSSKAVGTINTSAITAANANGLGALDARTFGEASIDLSAIFPPGTCRSFGSAYLKSRSADTFTSAVKDFIAPAPVNISSCGTIIVDKVTLPSGDPQSFAFSLTGGTSNLNESFSLTDAATPYERRNILAGSGYSVAETLPAGWRLVGSTCSDGSPASNISLDADETVTCTFTNEKLGKIIVDKVTQPSGDPQSFAFTLTGGPSNLTDSFSLTDTATPRASALIRPGSGYAVAETVPAGWAKIGSTCSDGSPVGNVDVDPGETVTCTFTNQKLGRVIVRKETDPAGATGTFGFTSTGGLAPATFSLGHSQSTTYTNVTPGSFTVTETDPAPAFDLVGIDCSASTGAGTSAGVNLATRTASITLAPGGTIDCTYTNRQRGEIRIDKVTDPSGDTTSFPFTLTGGPSTLDQSFNLADASPVHSSGKIKAGSGYAAAEDTPTGWDLTSSVCSDGSPVSNVNVSPGEIVTCTFTNRARGRIDIHKVDDNNPGSVLTGATFTLYQDNDPFGGVRNPLTDTPVTPAVTCTTNAAGDCSMIDLLPGRYWVVETNTPSGYTTAADQAVTVGNGSTVPLTFVNKRQFTVVVLVCQEGTGALYPSQVTLDGDVTTSMAAANLPAGVTQAEACSLGNGGATKRGRYEDLHYGNYSGSVNIPQ